MYTTIPMSAAPNNVQIDFEFVMVVHVRELFWTILNTTKFEIYLGIDFSASTRENLSLIVQLTLLHYFGIRMHAEHPIHCNTCQLVNIKQLFTRA